LLKPTRAPGPPRAHRAEAASRLPGRWGPGPQTPTPRGEPCPSSTATASPSPPPRPAPAFEAAHEILLEIVHGEGGSDSKLFVAELRSLYERYAATKGLKTEVLEEGDGTVTLKVRGRDAGRAFRHEGGKHCVQRVPPTERSGRRQTSLVIVAVLPLPPEGTFEPLPEGELEVKTQPGRQRAGGQHANKTASAVRMRHRPTGLSVFISGRCQKANRKEALRVLTARVNEHRNGQAAAAYAQQRAEQLSSRGRGNKVRTYNFIDRRVTDHRLGRETTQVKELMKGDLDLLLA
jgi:peptide chain release factor 1